MRNVDQNTNQAKPTGTIDLTQYDVDAPAHQYVNNLAEISPDDAEHFLNVGIDAVAQSRSATFIQKDNSVIHACAKQNGVEVLPISEARKKHGWLEGYIWRAVDPASDKYTGHAKDFPHEGYFIRTDPGVHLLKPVQSCLYIAKNGFSQNVHNVVIAEPNSQLQVITGCATAPHLVSGMHVGVSEFYIKKSAKLFFTMIHHWGKQINVRPRTVIHVEEGGVLVSNFISLKPVGSLQMYPTTYLEGPGAVARFNSILVAGRGSTLDVGSRVVLNAPQTRAEIISRAITSGGEIIARGELIGNSEHIKAHLECRGLILRKGIMRAIPELRGSIPGVEMSHEAAVGKIDQREIEYLMARGLDEESAISTIVRGFLNVEIEGLPSGLKQKIDDIIKETEKDMM
jgi:Fe-S cluster assembly scaffold protein SufB